MKCLLLVPDDSVAASIVDAVATCASSTFGLMTERAQPFSLPAEAFDAARRQFDSMVILRHLARTRPSSAFRMLGLTERDICLPTLTFLFGQGQLGGAVALVSLARLRQEFYGFPPDPILLAKRACKESLHELGHTFGLRHCAERTCVMSLSTTILQVDVKEPAFCPSCAVRLRESEAHHPKEAEDRQRRS